MNLPEWATKDENYQATSTDRDLFLVKSFLRIVSVLSELKTQAHKKKHSRNLTVAAIILSLLTIIFVSSSQSKENFLIALAAVSVVLAFQDSLTIRRVLKMSLTAAIFSALIMFPAIFFGQTKILFLIPAKTFLTATTAKLLTEIFSWHEIIAALKFFRVPPLVIFIFDTTLRFMVLIGDSAQEMLTALKLRSVGKNPDKIKSIGGIIGALFLKSQQMAVEMEQAMRCRGW